MAPGTWNAPGENDTVALAGGVAYCKRPKSAMTRCSGAEVPDRSPACTLEWGE
jgi:hypothetical protein